MFNTESIESFKKNYMKLIGKKLKPLKLQMKHIQHLYKMLLSFTIIIFLKKKIKLKAKDLKAQKNPWITRGIKKSSKLVYEK